MTEKELTRLRRNRRNPSSVRKRSMGAESEASTPEDLYENENLSRDIQGEAIDVFASQPGNDRAARMAQGAVQGGGAKDTLGNIGIASGNPYAMAAGAGLKVLGAAEKRKQADRQARYRAKLEQIARKQNALNNLMQMSRGLKL